MTETGWPSSDSDAIWELPPMGTTVGSGVKVRGNFQLMEKLKARKECLKDNVPAINQKEKPQALPLPPTQFKQPSFS
ncbi:hypothetical protein AAY473_004919, partial [Plecturocebus cupreus]